MTAVTQRRRRDGVAVGLTVWGILVFAFLFLPIVVIIMASFNSGRLLVAWDGFSFAPFAALVEKPVIRDAVMVSLRTGLIAALFAAVLGTLAGIAMARRPGKWVWWFLGLLLLVSVTPEIVDAVALLPWLVFLGQDLGLGMFNDGTVRLVVGHSLFSIAIVSYIVRARLVGLDARLEEASADLGAGVWTTFRLITFPQLRSALLAGGLLAFALSFDEIIVTTFTAARDARRARGVPALVHAQS